MIGLLPYYVKLYIMEQKRKANQILLNNNIIIYIMGAGILPVAIYKNQLYFLFGKERDRPLETARGWADFGGGNDYKETNLSTAAREGAEELSGFLGNRNKIKNHLRKKKMTIKTDDNNYTTFIVPIDYDTNLPKYFNNQISFINEYVDNYKLNNTTMYEKQEIKRGVHRRLGLVRPVAVEEVRANVNTTHQAVASGSHEHNAGDHTTHVVSPKGRS